MTLLTFILAIISLIIGVIISLLTSRLLNLVAPKLISDKERSIAYNVDIVNKYLSKSKNEQLSNSDLHQLSSSIMNYMAKTNSKDHALLYLNAICKNVKPQLSTLCEKSKVMLDRRFPPKKS